MPVRFDAAMALQARFDLSRAPGERLGMAHESRSARSAGAQDGVTRYIADKR
jgi:hypothetical protein